MSDYIEGLRFSYLSTITLLPAISIPVGFSSEGMPVGMQLIASLYKLEQVLAEC